MSLGFGPRAASDAGPRDLHELALALAPAGFRKMISQPQAVWRASTDGGVTLRWRGLLTDVTTYLRSQGVFG